MGNIKSLEIVGIDEIALKKGQGILFGGLYLFPVFCRNMASDRES